jgi:hypothetical protein
LSNIGTGYSRLISGFVAPTLSNLCLNFNQSLESYKTLKVFLDTCRRVKNLKLIAFDFGDAQVPSSTITDGFSRLRQLGVIYCWGNMSQFFKHTPISNLMSFSYESYEGATDGSATIAAAA